MEIKIITDQQTWESFFNQNGSPSFLQSWEWGNLQQALKYQVFRLGLYKENVLIAIFQTIKVSAKRGSFLFIPHGPLVNVELQSSLLKAILTYLVRLAKEEKCIFIRVAPSSIDVPHNQQLFSNLGFRKAPIYMHAERLWLLSLDKNEEQLLAGMRKTTRYLIKKAQRENVSIEKRSDENAINDFWKIYQETAIREKFTPFSKKFISDEFNCFNQTNNGLFFFAKHNSAYLASALIIFTKSTASYHQGASIHTKIPATYLLQWEVIKEAKKRGCQLYNFWGILHPGRSPKNWSGLTLFKQGFGGYQVDYLPTQDYILSPKYHLTFLYEKLLNYKRGI